jgi:hypothetical protein
LNHPQNRRNCPYFVKISLKVQAEKTVLSNNKAFYRAFSPEPGERSDFANSIDEFLAITNRRLCEPDLALANPLDKFELGIRKLIEDFMMDRMGENDKIVTRYMADRDFQASAFPILAREIFDAVRYERLA